MESIDGIGQKDDTKNYLGCHKGKQTLGFRQLSWHDTNPLALRTGCAGSRKKSGRAAGSPRLTLAVE